MVALLILFQKKSKGNSSEANKFTILHTQGPNDHTKSYTSKRTKQCTAIISQ